MNSINCFKCKDEMKYIKMGSSSNIYLCKSCNIICKKIFNSIDNEFNVIKYLNSLNKNYFPKFLFQKDNLLYYNYIDGYDLNSYRIFYLSLKDKVKIIKKIYNILLDLEKTGYNHLDLSKGNIMIDLNYNVYLVDFRTLNNKINSNENYGSYSYIPYEYFKERKIIFNKFDIFSFCLITFELLFNEKIIMQNIDFNNCICKNYCKNYDDCLELFLKNKLNKIKNDLNEENCKFLYNLLFNGLININKRKTFQDI